MTEVFQECESNFYRSIRSAQKALKKATLSQLQLNQIGETLKDASQELNKMEIQYRLNQSQTMKSKIDLFRQQLKNYKKEFQKHQNKFKEQIQRNSGPLFDNEQQNDGIKNLIQGKRQMYQNQAISNQIALGIKSNNDKLRNGITKLQNIDNELTIAQKLLGSIKRKMRKNKFILWGTFGALMLVLCLIIYSYVK